MLIPSIIFVASLCAGGCYHTPGRDVNLTGYLEVEGTTLTLYRTKLEMRKQDYKNCIAGTIFPLAKGFACCQMVRKTRDHSGECDFR